MTVFVRFAAVALSAGSLIGCCHSSCHKNPCDPCGGGHHHSHKAKKWMNQEIDAWRVRNTCGCDTCGGGSGFEMSPHGAPMMDQGGGCASCSQGQGMNYAPAMAPIPELQAPVAPPAPPAETTMRVHPAMAPAQYVPAQYAPGRPVPQFVHQGQAPQMAFAVQSRPGAAPQMPLTQVPPNEVSYEEFQRLPGVVTSGPGAAPQMVQQQQYTVPPANFAQAPAAQQFVAAPAAAPVAAPVISAPVQPIRQAAAVAPQINPAAPAVTPQAGGTDGWRPAGQ